MKKLSIVPLNCGGKLKNLAMAVVVRNGKVLIQQRYRRNKGMVYEFPGGSVDGNETGEQSAIRELREETGIVTDNVVASYRYVNEYGGSIYYVVLNVSTATEPRATDPQRQQIFRWLTREEIPQENFFTSDKQFINMELNNHI